MTSPFPALEGASFVLPDGRPLFSDLTLQLDRRSTGLIGRNGVGKSVIARVLGGELAATGGRCLRPDRVYFLPQQIAPAAGATVASVAGVADALQALERIEAGSVDVADFDILSERWDLPQQLRNGLHEHGLAHLSPQQPAASLSGGELTRVALLGAWLAQADYLILDEPSNHLDRPQRQLLRDRLQQWSKGVLVVSHDRELLQAMQRIVELSTSGLHDHGGDFAYHLHCRTQQQERAAQELQRRKQERRRAEAELRTEREKLDRRTARGARHGKEANQARILLGLQRQRSEATAGKLRQQHAQRREALNEGVALAAGEVENTASVALFAPLPGAAAQRRVAVLDQVVLPHGYAGSQPLDLVISGCQRMGVSGANGSGKSTLLQVLAGSRSPQAGSCAVMVPCAYLGQRLEVLDPQVSVLQQLLAQASGTSEATLRSKLALLGLDSAAACRPSGQLSGGERLKAALACVLYREQPAQLLLLDEPTNHLDLASMEALEQMLQRFHGALLVVSHDQAFLDRLGLDTRLHIASDGWELTPWR